VEGRGLPSVDHVDECRDRDRPLVASSQLRHETWLFLLGLVGQVGPVMSQADRHKARLVVRVVILDGFDPCLECLATLFVIIPGRLRNIFYGASLNYFSCRDR